MNTFLIQESKNIDGFIEISGSKNACLPLLAAATLLKNNITLYDIPNIYDVHSFLNILKIQNVDYSFKNSELSLNFDNYSPKNLTDNIMKSLRASYYLIPVLAKDLESFEVSLPGGCNFASRPIDLHQKVFKAFGLENYISNNKLLCKRKKLNGTTFEFEYKSLGATINAILMASIVEEVTTLINVSIEPEVICLIDFLKQSGINNTLVNSTLIIKGNKKCNKINSFINIKDRIEAGTFLILGALKGNPLTIKSCPINDLASVFNVFDYLNVKYEINDKNVSIYKTKIEKSVLIEAGPYPMFPSDLLPIMVSYLGSSNLIHIVKDTIYPSRNQYTNELNKIGYNIQIKNNEIIIFPNTNIIKNNIVESKDIRCGASLILGAINTNEKIEISGIEFIKRGYSNMLNKLRKIGVNIDERN